ncbi:hypothetical protein GCM10023185_23500 [Hymenobacter saemangeumensis]|uniref:Uncharacterized protein n=1 Tax=Hymenobacter saemangeumensis TaxID=1084522 RepID=A0ABP8IG75_9BACT
MSSNTLAFLQNFYTDVTLYVPAEAEPAGASAPAVVAEQAAELPAPPTTAAPLALPLPAAGAAAPPVSATPKLPSLGTMPARPAAAEPAPQAAAPAPVQIPAAAAPAATPSVPPVMQVTFSTQGSRADGVLLLVRLPHEQFLKLPRNVFLNKMLQALGLVMADVVLVNVESHLPVALVNLRRELAATQIIAFGKNLLDVTIRNTQIYEPVQFPSLNLSYLASAEIDLVEYDVSLKKRLWPGLQAMFLR